MASVRDLKIRELKQLAKERGLKGYSKKNKSELVQMLQTPNPNKNVSSRQYEKKENPVDEPVPDIEVPVVTPQPLSRVQRLKRYLFDKVKDTKKYAKSKCNVNWLLEHVPPKF